MFLKPAITKQETAISSARANVLGRADKQQIGGPGAQLADAIRQEHPVIALLGIEAAPVLAAIDECLAILHDDPIRVIRVHGLPGVPLTLPRIVEELGARERNGLPADDDELIVRVLAGRNGQENQLALIIEQAELLPLPTLAFLQGASTVFGTRTPRLQLIFAGHPRFEQLLVRADFAGLRDRLHAVIRVAQSPAIKAPAPLAVNAADRRVAASRKRPAPRVGRNVRIAATLIAVTLGIAAATFAVIQPDAVPWANPAERDVPSSALRADPPLARPPSLSQPPPQASQPPALPPQAAPSQTSPPLAAVPPGIQDASPAVAVPRADRGPAPSGERLGRLRSEFDRFLATTEWGSKRLSEGERARLFNEYIKWNYGASGTNSGPPP